MGYATVRNITDDGGQNPYEEEGVPMPQIGGSGGAGAISQPTQPSPPSEPISYAIGSIQNPIVHTFSQNPSNASTLTNAEIDLVVKANNCSLGLLSMLKKYYGITVASGAVKGVIGAGNDSTSTGSANQSENLNLYFTGDLYKYGGFGSYVFGYSIITLDTLKSTVLPDRYLSFEGALTKILIDEGCIQPPQPEIFNDPPEPEPEPEPEIILEPVPEPEPEPIYQPEIFEPESLPEPEPEVEEEVEPEPIQEPPKVVIPELPIIQQPKSVENPQNKMVYYLGLAAVVALFVMLTKKNTTNGIN